MKKLMTAVTAAALLAASGATVLTCVTGSKVAYALAITFGTVLYHFAMRLAVGGIINGIYHNRMDHTRRWFKPWRFESRLYKLLKIERIKGNIPTYSPDTFAADKHSLDELIGATCQAEVVHEIIMLLSLLPIAATAWFGEPGVFISTSVAALFFDSVFMMLQRYNRPRLVRLLEWQKRRNIGYDHG